MFSYKTSGTCAQEILFDIQDNRIVDVKFIHGCGGNTKGVAALVVGMTVDEVISRLEGIQCRNGTSCPDQLARALRQYQNSQKA